MKTVKDIMSTKLITLHPKDKMERVKEIFDAYAIHHIPIIINGDIIGLISKSDFLQIQGIAKNGYDEFIKSKIMQTEPVENYMHSEIVVCDPDTPLSSVLNLFLENEIRCIPVVQEGQLIGLVTPLDLLRNLKDKI